jgi:hypothetical protein
MNFIRGILSIGIIIICMLNWVDIDIEMIMISVSGLKWTSSTILLFASVFTAGYAFYNSYNNSNRNAWIYLTSGLYGTGVTIFIYLSMFGFFDFMHTIMSLSDIDELVFNFGLGIYLSGIFSFLLFLTGFDKSENKTNVNSYNPQQIILEHQNNVQIKKDEKLNKPNINEWKRNNPGRTINDYYSKYK